ncbi:MAG: hypothetical protein AAF355_05735 [Myxococcota bacterium]
MYILVGGFLSCALISCIDGVSETRCVSDQACLRDRVFGQCVSGYCAFDDGTCSSGLRFDQTAAAVLAGSCTSESTKNDLNPCGGTTILKGTPGDACGLCSSGTLSCADANTLICTGEYRFVEEVNTAQVQASSTSPDKMSSVENILDGSLETSWFTDQSEATVTWTAEGIDCIDMLRLNGNQFHNPSEFRQGFGFSVVQLRLLDSSDVEVYQEIFNWGPEINTASFNSFGPITASKIELIFSSPESSERAGFSEMNVWTRIR